MLFSYYFLLNLIKPIATTNPILVFTLSRHGDRSPIHSLPNDPYKDHWTHGYGQLTKLGANQHYNLGQFIRHRYGHIISLNYHKDQVFFRSSATERTLMSANNFARGLYADQIPHFQPPIYSVPSDEDHLLKMSSVCPEYETRLHRLLRSLGWDEITRLFEPLIAVLKNNLGGMYPTDATVEDVLRTSWSICDPLYIWVNHRIPSRPAWVTDGVGQQCSRLLDYKQSVMYSHPSLTQLRGGPLVAHVLHFFRARVNEEIDVSVSSASPHQTVPPLSVSIESGLPNRFPLSQRLIAYFAHDSTLAAVMSHLSIHNGLKPPLASCLMIELHHNLTHSSSPSDQYFIRFLYRNQTGPRDTHIYPLWPPGCGPSVPIDHMCSLTRLESAMVNTYAIHLVASCQPNLFVTISSVCTYPQWAVILLLQAAVLAYLITRLGHFHVFMRFYPFRY